MTKDDLRNALTLIEDDARDMRRTARQQNDVRTNDIVSLVIRLAQLVREEIVK